MAMKNKLYTNEEDKFITENYSVMSVKDNNDISNLVYCPDLSYHAKIHAQLRQISFELVQIGVIKFDKRNDKYYIDEAFGYGTT